MRRPPNVTIFVIAAAAGLAAFSGAPTQNADPVRPAGEGVLCTLALYSGLVQISARCAPDTGPEFQAELRRQVERLDAYALANGMTAEALAAFKAQNTPPLSDPAMCEAYRQDGIEQVLTVEPEILRSHVDELTARPGTPTWGVCV